MKKFNFLILFLFASFFASFSQVPGAFNYQAVVRNSSGDIVANTNVSFRISILQDSETGVPVYVETQNVSTNAFGLANLKIGRGTIVSGILNETDWNSAPHFIKVEMDPAGGSSFSLLGSSELLSVPYALQAENVSNDLVDDADADATNELQTLSISGNELSISEGNTIILPDSGEWRTTYEGIAYSNGHVGIGINPMNTSALTVSGGYSKGLYCENYSEYNPTIMASNINSEGMAAYFANRIRITDGHQGTGKVLTSDADGNASWQTPATSLWTDYESSNNIFSNKNFVSIGRTHSPSFNIVLDAYTNFNNYAVAAINNGSLPSLYASNQGSGPAALFKNKIVIDDGTQGIGKVLTSDADGLASWQTPSTSSSLWTESGSNIYRSSGNVGIGTNSPQKNLQIHGDENSFIGITNTFSGANITDGLQIGIAFDNNAYIRNSENSNLYLGTANDKQMTILNTGLIGIGTTSPEAKLDVRNTDPSIASIFATGENGWAIHANSYESGGVSVAALSTGGTAVLAEAAGVGSAKLCSTIDGAAGYFYGKVIINNGNLGIGTNSPEAPLHISSNSSPTLILSSTSTNVPDRPGIQFKNNTSQYISGDDGSDEIFGFYSTWANARTYNAKLRVYGQALSSWGNYIELSHDGTDGIINTDVGDIVLAANTQRVGINTSLPTVSLDVNGNARVRSIPSGTGTYAIVVGEDGTFSKTSSDIRLKENIAPLNNSLDKIMQLRGVTFSWKANPEYGTRIGFIAQEFEKVIPELAFTNEVDGYKGINYAEISAVLVEAMKEQQKIIEAMKTENELLKDENKQIMDRLEKLERMIRSQQAN